MTIWGFSGKPMWMHHVLESGKLLLFLSSVLFHLNFQRGRWRSWAEQTKQFRKTNISFKMLIWCLLLLNEIDRDGNWRYFWLEKLKPKRRWLADNGLNMSYNVRCDWLIVMLWRYKIVLSQSDKDVWVLTFQPKIRPVSVSIFTLCMSLARHICLMLLFAL